VRVFVLPVSPEGPDPRVRWIESHCTRRPQPPHRRPVPYASFLCGPGPASRPAHTATGAPVLRTGRSGWPPRWSRAAAGRQRDLHPGCAGQPLADPGLL